MNPTFLKQTFWTLAAGLSLLGAACGPPVLAADTLVISEFMAANSSTLADEDGSFEDWIEVHNVSPAPLDLLNWALTDRSDRLAQWRFPSTNLPPGGYLVVFASGKDRRVPGARLHTNFKLSAGGEYLALVEPDGLTVATEFPPPFAPQLADISYGFGAELTSSLVLDGAAAVRYLIPPDGRLGTTWTLPGFDDTSWTQGTNGLGYETGPPEFPLTTLIYSNLIRTDLGAAMANVNASALFRFPFVITNLARLERLVLRIQYDDGFAAYVNGQPAVATNAPASLEWNSTATQRHFNSPSVAAQEFDLSDLRGNLVIGTNVLAIQGLNFRSTNTDFLILPELAITTSGGFSSTPRYFRKPTPGAANGTGSSDVGPILSQVSFTPALPGQPGDNDAITVTARVSPAFSPVTSLLLRYRVMFGVTNTLPMLDDGQHGDGAAGDGLFGAVIPASASAPGQMVRFQIAASDQAGHGSRWPLYEDTNSSPAWLGTVVANPAVTSALPIWEWFAQDTLNALTRVGARCAVFHRGRFYDNVGVRLRGAGTTVGQKFDFNPGEPCAVSAVLSELEEVNLNNQAFDPSFIRPPLAHEVFRTAGNAACLSFNMLMRVNGTADRVGILVEQVDERFLRRNGLDASGALYKFINRSDLNPVFTDAFDGVEKKTRLNEDRADLTALCRALLLTNGPAQLAQRAAFLFDHVNLPALLNHLACRSVIMDSDDVRKNIYMYRDTRGNGEWTIVPWDKDWTFGILGDGGPFLTHPFFASQQYLKQSGTQWSLLYDAVFTDPRLSEMYLRRLRSVMDQQLQPPGTVASNGYLEARAASWFAPAFPKLGGGPSNTVFAANGSIYSFLQDRRKDLYVTYSVTNAAASAADRLVPQGQPFNVAIRVGGVDYNPASGNQAEEYLCLTNPARFAVDLSGWRLEGAIRHTFKPGTVIGTTNVLYVSPDVVAFRARSTGPGAGQSLAVQGNYEGSLSARGETIRIVDAFGRVADQFSYPGSPSPAQQFLRVTELMYHPAPPPGETNLAEAFEFIELKNIGSTALDLAGVRFVDGVEFNFTGSSVTRLAPAQTVVIVHDPAAFAARYGAGPIVAGQYVGSLNNGGERLRLVDAAGEEILDFSYSNQWYPITDGLGFSLVASDELGDPQAWGDRTGWRASAQPEGSPGATDPVPPGVASILVNEALTRTETPPPTDTIELFNPTAGAVSLGGWFLSDDFSAPKKFRIPDGTTIAAGGWQTFDESSFNRTPGVGGSFGLGSAGDSVFLFSADAAGNLTGYFHGFKFGAAEKGVSFGRHVTSDGREEFVAQAARTLGAANAGPRVGPLMISEVMYHPAAVSTNDAGAREFIELRNISGATVPLFDPAAPANTWTVTGGVDYRFPTNRWLAAGEYALLVNFDPALDVPAAIAFRTWYGVGPDVILFGPWNGQLNHASDRIKLNQPTDLVAGVVPFVLVDEVDYRDSAPWPPGADGFGLSLQRLSAVAYGNDPANWTAAPPTASQPTAGGAAPPAIVVQPTGRTLIAFQDLTLGVSATGSAPLRYQWRREGVDLTGATNAVLQLSNLQPGSGGNYQVLVWNVAGSAVSSNAPVSLLFPATILQQPQAVAVRPGSNPSFRVQAYSPYPVRYQWRFNDEDISAATNDTYALTNVQLPQQGSYAVSVIDDIGSVLSAAAPLFVLIAPVITQHPQSVTAVQGDTVRFHAAATGSPSPLSFRWRRNGATLVTLSSNQFTSTYTIQNVQPTQAGAYTVVAANLASSGVLSSAAQLVVLADTDGDHLPDVYETPERGLNPRDPGDALLDFDGDGFDNLQEYIAGTDPNDATSRLQLEQVPAGTAPMAASFVAASNRNYSVQFREAPEAGLWTRLADVLARPSNRVETVLDPYPVTGQRLYRLVTPLQAPPPLGPVILKSPRSQAVDAGASLTLEVVAQADGPIGYQWLFNRTKLKLETNAILNLINLQTNAIGDYSVALSAGFGVVTSELARVTVLVPPVITAQPRSQNVAIGATVIFQVEASGVAPLTYRWLFNGTPVRGATGPVLTLDQVTPAEAGRYSVVVKHQTAFGPASVISESVQLNVQP